MRRLNPILEERQIILNPQFDFKIENSTLAQEHIILIIIQTNLKKQKKNCSGVYLDVSQRFVKVTLHLVMLLPYREKFFN